MSKQWLLIVFDGRGHDRLLHKIGMRPATKKAGQYVGFYSLGAEAQLRRHIQSLREVGLHGIARKVEARPPTKTRAKPSRRAQAAAPSGQIIMLQTAKENRLARDALKLAQEKRRQAERAAEAQVNRRAKEALLRSKGEL